MPTPQDLADIRAVLARERASTLGRIDALDGDLAAVVEASDAANLDDEHDPEGATVAFERAQVIALLDAARRHLASIDGTMDRLSAGTYGTCARCGQPIPVERLLAVPDTETCVGCAGQDASASRR